MAGDTVNLRKGFTVKEWTIQPLEGCLERDGEVRRVQPKSMDVLLCLAQADGNVVEREEILNTIWGERWVSDEPLTRCIGELRRAFGDKRSQPEYILTVPKRGYRLLPKPIPLAEDSTDRPETPQLTRQQKARRRTTLRRIATGLAILVLAALIQVAVERALEGPQPAAPTATLNRDLDARSIAVLPFVDMSTSGDQEYMSDGIAEEVLSLLTKVHELRVISRSSSFSFKGQSVDVPTIAARFGVAYVLEGSVRTAGNRIRISAQLIDARTDTHVWAETYDLELDDVFAIQEEIAAAVVDKLEITLLPGTVVSRETNPEAYALFLQARYLHEQPAGESFKQAFDFYEKALELDPNYVPAWVWLAALYDDTINSSELSREDVVQRIFAASDRALAIDPDDPLALAMSAVLLMAHKDDVETAVARMEKALALDARNPIVLRWAAIVLVQLGQYEDAVTVGEYLFARDPIGNISRINLASIYLMAGYPEDTIRICEVQVAAVGPSGPCQSRLILAYLYAGQLQNAGKQLEQTTTTRVHTRLAPMVYFSLGRPEDYDTALAELHSEYEGGDIGLANWLAHTYTFVNDTDSAFEWLRIARQHGVLTFNEDISYYRRLHGDPRWPGLLTEFGLVKASGQRPAIQVRLPD